MHRKKVLNTHLKDSSLSSPISATPKRQDCKWLLTPTNTASGIWCFLVLYVVSKVMASPKSAYAALQLAFDQKMFFYSIFFINLDVIKEFLILLFHFLEELEHLWNCVLRFFMGKSCFPVEIRSWTLSYFF